jgi:hypothetical protein
MPLHVSSITYSSSGGATQAALGILRACYVSWLHKVWSVTGVFDTSYTPTLVAANLLQIAQLNEINKQ